MSASPGTSEDPESLHAWSHLDARTQERLTEVLRVQVPEVFRLNRAIERKTGYTSEIGQNMLVDVLAHLATLSEGRDLTPEKEANQLAKIEEHLRRAIIEHPEEVIRLRTSELAELWVKYNREAFPLREAGVLHGAPRHTELESLRMRIDSLLEASRRQKPKESSWAESLDIAAEITEAAGLTEELANKLDQCIGVAMAYQRDQDRQATVDAHSARRDKRTLKTWAIGVAVTLVFGAAGVYAKFFHSADETGPSSSKSQPASPARP